MTKVVPLVSGGIDSSVMMYRELITKGNEVHPLAIDYGQKNIGQERQALLKIWGHLESMCDERTNRRLHSIKFLDVSIMRHIFKSGITWPDIDIPDHNVINKDDADPSFVPFRNPFLISIGVACANLVGAEKVLIGSHASVDPENRPAHSDSNDVFIDIFKTAVFVASKEEVRLEAPFVHMPKEEVIRMGVLLQVPLELTYGCYRDKSYPCGTCSSCFERKRAFKSAGVEDKTIYIDDPKAKKNCCG
jgi:7-cyano-7-deazaguanine synthase